ncbi:NADH dehydrogenase [ubiquinone] 1 beta subcomplex subunit 5, mitochondrial-like [Stegodyphus dumicola]|uniref:NADH dehydrogenase [ubiquinone] 1 beta subcomplex subunit 5, mitochondrial-like n=1 Tax=Stegodyphus dumicola TaxID=202533 RepID=UPI0015AA0805|nr:NADH dehydrogenase [ubiquinone] 1 beta subcomplex subunit 5, mitochondrial-like [Stegodyphus dumicola]
MSGGDEDRTMYITPTRYQYTVFKDNLHFYFMVAAIPLGLLILYCNIFIGPATLTEIPEGYEPKHWEYYKHPISRFIAKYFFDDPQITYEQTLHYLNDCLEKFEWSNTIDKAKYLMATRDDYKAWYFMPSDQGRHYRYARKLYDEMEEERGFK